MSPWGTWGQCPPRGTQTHGTAWVPPKSTDSTARVPSKGTLTHDIATVAGTRTHQQAQMWHGDSSATGATCQPPAAPNLPIPDASFLSAPASARQTAASAPDRGTRPGTGASSPGHRTRGPALVSAHWDTGHKSQHRCLLTRTPGTRPGSGAGPSGHWEEPWGDPRILCAGCGTGQMGCRSGHQGCQRAMGLGVPWWGNATPVRDASPGGRCHRAG